MDHFIETVRKYPCLWNTTAIEYRDQELKDAAWAEVMKETDLSSVKEVKLKWKKLRDSYRDALKRQSEMLAKEPSNTTKKNYPWKYMGLMQFLQPYMSNRKKPAEAAGYGPPAGDSLDAHDAHDAHDNGHDTAHDNAQALAHAHATNGDAHSSDSDSSEAESSSKRKSCERLTVIDRKLDYLCKAQNKRHCGEPQHAERKRGSPAPPLPPPPPPLDPLDIFFNSMCQSTKRFPFPAQIKIKKTLFNAVIEAEEALVAEQQNYASLWAQEAGSSSSSDGDEEDRKPS